MIQHLIGLVALTMLVIHPIAVQFSFRWKRALFAGGGSSLGADEAVRDDSQIEPGDLPRVNVYEIERRVFDLSGVKRFPKFPVDLLLAPGYYLLFNLMISFASGSRTFDSDANSTANIIVNLLGPAMLAVFFSMATARLVLRYKLRRESGNV
jgi:hypothetical protein